MVQRAKREARASRQERKAEKLRQKMEAEQEARTQAVRPKKNVKAFRPLTDAQAYYADAIDLSTYIFALGPAGTGKTYVAACKLADHLKASTDNRAILTRPALEAGGENLGYLPGELAEKFGPYMKPLMRILIDRLSENYVDCAIKNERLIQLPLAFMRGETFDNALILATEMQNATREQFKMLLTRIGQGSRMVIEGDPKQIDLPRKEESGLEDAVRRLSPLQQVAVVRFDKTDIVRHDIIQDVLTAYEELEPPSREPPPDWYEHRP